MLQFLLLAGDCLFGLVQVFGEGGGLGLEGLELLLQGLGVGFEELDLLFLLGGEVLLGLQRFPEFLSFLPLILLLLLQVIFLFFTK